MFSLKDLLALLDHWPLWKRIKATPEQLEILEKRVSGLETRLSRCPGEACPRCGELSFRVTSSKSHLTFSAADLIVHKMKCEKCGFEEDKTLNPNKIGS
jgi:ribosomal protein L37E